jgi:hypothetical protein
MNGKTMKRLSGWMLAAGSLVLVGVLSLSGAPRQDSQLSMKSETRSTAAAASEITPGPARAEVDVLDLQLD